MPLVRIFLLPMSGVHAFAPRLGNPAGGLAGHMGSTENTRRLERRWAPRYGFRTSLDIEWGSTLLRAQTRDISASGMFIESVDPLWIGAGFTAHLQLERTVKVNCFVKRVEPGLGMGVSVSFSERQHEPYQQLIEHLSRTQSAP